LVSWGRKQPGNSSKSGATASARRVFVAVTERLISEESITQAKKEKLIASALTYTTTHQDLPSLWCIDVVAIELDDKGKPRRIELIENAIEQDSRFNC